MAADAPMPHHLLCPVPWVADKEHKNNATHVVTNGSNGSSSIADLNSRTNDKATDRRAKNGG